MGWAKHDIPGRLNSGFGLQQSGMEAEKKNPRTVICVGDIHGHIHRLRDLWRNLEAKVGSELFNTSTVIFLGDYNDRGPDTKQVLEFLIALPHLYPEQRHVFLCGNHDFAFAAFVGALPPLPHGFEYSSTWPEFEHNEEREGWWSGPGQEEIHLQVSLASKIFMQLLTVLTTTLTCFKDFTKMPDSPVPWVRYTQLGLGHQRRLLRGILGSSADGPPRWKPG